MSTERTRPTTRRIFRCHDEVRDGSASRLAMGFAAAIAAAAGRDVAILDQTEAGTGSGCGAGAGARVRLVREDGTVEAWVNAPAPPELLRRVPFVIFVTDAGVPAAEQAALERLAERTLFVSPDTAGARRWLEETASLQDAPRHPRAVVLPRGVPRPESADAVHRWPLSGHGSKLSLVRLARREVGMATGLVLGGGSARGYAHIGVLEALHEAKITWDMLGGTSGGGYVAGMWALGSTPARILEMCIEETVRSNPLGDVTLPVTALVKGHSVRASVKRVYGDVGIEGVPLDFFVMATDLLTGQAVMLDDGPLGLSCLASGSLPGIFPPVKRAPYLLVDGGVLYNVPGPQMRARGADLVVAVDLATDRDLTFGNPDGAQTKGWFRNVLRSNGRVREVLDAPGIIPILLRSLDLMMLGAVRSHAWSFDVHIRPDVNGFATLDFTAHAPLVEIGRAAGRASARAILQEQARMKARVQCDVDAAVAGALHVMKRARAGS